jgi:hypothetical protein
MLPEEWEEHRGGSNSEEVACHVGEDLDQNGDYTIAKGGTVEIAVRHPGQEPSEEEVFTVSGEAVMQYHAERKEAS